MRIPPHILVALTISITLFSCSETPPDTQKTFEYGTVINYQLQPAMAFPDFSISFVNHQSSDGYDSGTASATLFSFADKKGNAGQIIWDRKNRVSAYEAFKVGEKTFYIELDHSEFLNKALAKNEFIIWTLGDYRNRQLTLTSGNEAKTQQLAELYGSYVQAVQSGNWNKIKAFLSKKRISLSKEANRNRGIKDSRVSPIIKAPPIKQESLQAHQSVFSSSGAKLYLTADLTSGPHIIGVKLIKEGSAWKIEHEAIVPDDEAGEQWLKRFLEQ